MRFSSAHATLDFAMPSAAFFFRFERAMRFQTHLFAADVFDTLSRRH